MTETNIILADKLNGYEKIKELVDGELDNYGHFHIEKIEHYETYMDEEYYRAEIMVNGEYFNTLNLKYDIKEDEISIELGEDCYEKIESFDYTIKYFWMALLKW